MAREANGLRQLELASAIDRSAPTVSKYESGDQTPDHAVLQLLAKALNVGPSWFFRPLSTQSQNAVFFRSLVSTLALTRARARARLGYVEAIDEVVAKEVDFPEIDLPDLLAGLDFRTLRINDMNRIAHDLREHWELGQGPIDDLMVVVENAGIIVAEDDLGSTKLDGLSRWSEVTGRPYILLAKDKGLGSRRRFDLAHELGHIVLHRGVSAEALKEHFDLIEDQAMAFAGALLMPEETFAPRIFSFSLDAFADLKVEWKVSVGAMIKRLVALDIISEQQERRLWQYYSYRRWRTIGEPHDDAISMERPENLREAIQIVAGNDEMSRLNFLLDVGLSGEDIISLTGLPEGFFDSTPRNVVKLSPRLKQDDVARSPGLDGEATSVIDWRRKF